MVFILLQLLVFVAISFVVLYRVVSPTPTGRNTKIILLMSIPPLTFFGFILTLLLIFRDIYFYRVQLEKRPGTEPESAGH